MRKSSFVWSPVLYGYESVLNLFYPQHCSVCRRLLRLGEQLLCLHCQTELPKTALHAQNDNLVMDIFQGRLPLVKATSFLYFTQTGMVQTLLHELKYKDNKALGRYLGRIMAEGLQEVNWLQGMTAIVPVPLHVKKEHLRGYNQSALLAQGLSEVSGLPAWMHFLKRTKHTESQTQKNRMERWENVKDVFAVTQHKPHVKHVLLLDDVLTTGATLEACGRTLLRAYPDLQLSILTLALAKSF